MLTTKPKLFLWGACDLESFASTDVIRQHFDIDIFDNTLDIYQSNVFFRKECAAPSLMSFYSSQNVIAERVHESLLNSKIPLTQNHYRAYNEIVKFPYLEYFKNSVSENDYLLLSFSTELYTKVFTKNNTFTLVPAMSTFKNPSDPLHWLLKDFLYNTKLHLAFDSRESLTITWDILSDFAKDLFSIFKNRVVIVNTHLTNLAYSSKIGTVSTVKMTCDTTIPFYASSRLVLHNSDHSYTDHLIALNIKRFKKNYPVDVPVVDLKQPVFSDPDHKYGQAPFHLHHHSVYKIAVLIEKELQGLIKQNKDNNE